MAKKVLVVDDEKLIVKGILLPAGTSQKTRSSAFISMTERLSVFINTDHHKT